MPWGFNSNDGKAEKDFKEEKEKNDKTTERTNNGWEGNDVPPGEWEVIPLKDKLVDTSDNRGPRMGSNLINAARDRVGGALKSATERMGEVSTPLNRARGRQGRSPA